MSDFIFSTKPLPKQKVNDAFYRVYGHKIGIRTFEAKNNVLCITENIYNGYDPHETDKYVCAVIGGPVLKFRDNKFITSKNSNEGTQAIYNRWIIDNKIQWDDDLDGPFVVLLFNKHTGDLTVVTDMMSFIPVYQNQNSENLLVGTHLNTLDYINPSKVDQVSVADLIMNDVVTFPYTVFEGVFQVYPASIHKWEGKQPNNYSYSTYWLPYESDSDEKYNTPLLAKRLQKGLKSYIDRILDANPKVGILMSGGEDSRTVLGLMPLDYPKDGFMFAANHNNETLITQRTACANNVRLSLAHITPHYFPNTWESCSNLIGVGADCANVHAYGFHIDLNFDEYDVVLGGFLADTFLKSLSLDANENRFVYSLFLNKGKSDKLFNHKNKSYSLFDDEIVHKVNWRKVNHWETVYKFRPNNKEEWMAPWPISMQRDMPNIYGHRRLFRNFEPFTSTEIVKVDAIASQSIKTNRILFQKTVKPFLKRTKWIPHNNGFLPYYSNRFNNALYIPFLFKVYRKLFESKISKGSTWPNYNEVFNLPAMKEKEMRYLPSFLNECDKVFNSNVKTNVLDNNIFSDHQKRNILQVARYLHSRKTFRTGDNALQ